MRVITFVFKYSIYWFFTCFMIAVFPAFARKPAVEKRAELVVDVQTGRILHSYAATQKRYPASVTKMMTLFLVFDALENKKLSPKTRLKMTKYIKKLGKRNGGIVFTGLKAGKTITIREAVYTLITKSANDIAILLARHIAGSEKNFAKKMTKTAKQLGMFRTNFTNASGLPDKKQYTTAKDMAILGLRLMQKFPKYYKYFSVKKIKIKGQNLTNHNKLLSSYAGLDGFKTGYIRMSGFNLVASAKRGDQRLIGVVFGGRTGPSRDRTMAKILNIGWKKLTEKPKKKKYIGAYFKNIAALQSNIFPLEPSDNIITASIIPIHKEKHYKKTALNIPTGWQEVQKKHNMQIVITNDIFNKQEITLEDALKNIPPLKENKTIASEKYNEDMGRYHLQVGAFSREKTASQYLETLKEDISALSTANLKLHPVKRGNNTIYRARFENLAKKDARYVCTKLKKQGKQCLLLAKKS